MKFQKNKENILHNINPIDVIPVMCNLNLNIEINKKNISPDEARAITLATLHLKYPLDKWTHIYTDGSLTDCDEGAGPGETCRFFSFYKSIGKNTTNFDGEIDAIYTSLQNLFICLQSCQNIFILLDSKAAIQAIASINCPKMEKIKEFQRMLTQIQSLGKTIILQWIPAQGNEKADILAKKGSKIMQKLSYESIKRILKKENQ